jgi:hypothetical protein
MITKINNKNYRIDFKANRITFLDSRWYYDEKNNAVPSVTTILDAFPKGFALMQWIKKHGEDADTIRDEAGRKGSVVHNLTERYDSGETVALFSGPDDKDAILDFSISEWNMFEKYVEFSSRFPHDNLIIETNLVNAKIGYAGTIDRITYFPVDSPFKQFAGKVVLLDIKTGNYCDDSWYLQLAAYKKLCTRAKIHVDDVGIVWLNAKTKSTGVKGTCQGYGWQIITRTADEQADDLKLFGNVHATWKSQNKKTQPREVSYSLKHKIKSDEQQPETSADEKTPANI